MRILSFLAVLLGLTISQFAHAGEDPLVPAKEGKLWCYEPDFENKTCRSFSRFERDGAGNIWEEDEIAFSMNPLLTMKVRDTATIEGVSICQSSGRKPFRRQCS